MRQTDFARALFLYAMAGATAVGSAIHSVAARAQACSAADQQIRSQYSEATMSALIAGDLARYRSLQQSLPGELSSSCRQALNQLEPIRVMCTPEEKAAVLQHYQDVMQAAWSGDAVAALLTMEDLEDTVSPQCWLAANRQTDPGVQAACTSEELDHLASLAGPMLHATSHMLSTGDIGRVLQVTQELYSSLSEGCATTIVQRQQQAQQQPIPAKQYQPPSVIDHGGGTYSVPGLGACTPGGCMAY